MKRLALLFFHICTFVYTFTNNSACNLTYLNIVFKFVWDRLENSGNSRLNMTQNMISTISLNETKENINKTITFETNFTCSIL